jgi:hypothetical protein
MLWYNFRAIALLLLALLLHGVHVAGDQSVLAVSGKWPHKTSHRFPPHTNLQTFHPALRDGSLQDEICMMNECLTPLYP